MTPRNGGAISAAMPSSPQTSPVIKICGLSTAATLEAALEVRADMVGFVFFAPSPRHVSFAQALELAARVESRALKVALSVDADDAMLAQIIEALHPDILQLHGKETPERISDIKSRFALPVMKAIHISEVADLAAIAEFESVADRLLFDARPTKGALLPGGNGAAFDWTILDGVQTTRPWMLSGGLNPGNVEEALHVTRAPGLDVSSGVESAPGVKDAALIADFVTRARRALGSPAKAG